MIIKKGNENILCEDGIVSGDSNTVMIANNTQIMKEIMVRMTAMEAAIVTILQELNK